MTLEIGDIVSCRGHKWAVAGFNRAWTGNPTKVGVNLVRIEWKQRRKRLGITVGEGDCTLILRPTFTPGQRVKFDHDLMGTVVVDNVTTVRLALDDQRLEFAGGGHHVLVDGKVDASRADLVIRNFEKELGI